MKHLISQAKFVNMYICVCTKNVHERNYTEQVSFYMTYVEIIPLYHVYDLTSVCFLVTASQRRICRCLSIMSFFHEGAST
jgi:hypothetical protein